MKRLWLHFLRRESTRCHHQWISRILSAVLALSTALFPFSACGTPYASSIVNNAGTISFILNEPADNVTVVLDAGVTVLDLGALDKGPHTFLLGVASTFEIVVRKVAAVAWTLTSSDTNSLLHFNSPRGVAVNLNTNSPAFGRIYVANSTAGTTTSGRAVGDGLYLLNADQSDALGRGDGASTAGIVFTSGGQQAFTPWHIEVGPDNFLYIADFSTNTGTIYRTDADVNPGTGVNIFTTYGITNTSVHTTIGSSPVVRGSLDTGDLTVWAIDGRAPGSGSNNRLFRWNINGGPLPYGLTPTPLGNPLITTSPDITSDLDRGPDAKFYLMQNRSVGNEAGIFVLDSDGTTLLWDSLSVSRTLAGNVTAVDYLRQSRAVKVSPDGSRMAVIRDDLQTWVIPLINGIPDLANRELVATYSGPATTLGRDVCFDAAGNLYALSSGNQLLRVFSPGGATVATTRSDGTFSLSFAAVPTVAVSSSGDLNESSAGPANFVLTRTGDTSAELTVNFQFAGTASNGVDYVLIPAAATFGVGESSTAVPITPIDDNVAEFLESIILTLVPGNYIPATNGPATINIVDNEYPNVLSLSALDTNTFERFTNDVFTFTITRLGDTNVETYANLTFSGTAVEGTDFGTAMNPLLIPAGAVTVNLTLSPINDSELEGDEAVTLTLIPGGDYEVGSPDSVTVRLRDDELPPGTVLFADHFENDTSAAWITQFGANNGIYDATNIFAYDYVAAGVPLAPHSAPGTGRGLFVAVNKNNTNALGAAGINLYPAGQSFAGDFALRFDMFLSFGTAGTTEHAIAGINHSTLHTNRVTQSADPNNTTWGGDGVWVAIETDGSGNRDYTAYTTTNDSTVPAIIASRSATSMAPLVTSPPYAFPGSPGVNATSGREWSMVELSQIGGVVTLKVNAAIVFVFTNTTGFTSGDVMLGMNDQFDSIGSAANYVIFDNVEVVRLGSALAITGIRFPSPGTVEIDFAADGANEAEDFHLQSTGSLSPMEWVDDPNAVIERTPGGFRITTVRSGEERFYRVRR